MTRNLVKPETAEENRVGRPGGYTFNTLPPDDYGGVVLVVAVVRLGDHAHLDVSSGRAVPGSPHLLRGGAGRLILRWHEWELLRSILEPHECVRIAEVENPTEEQARFHTGPTR